MGQFLLYGFCVVLSVGLLFVYRNAREEHQELRQKYRNLKERNQTLTEKNRELERRRTRLKNDPAAIKRVLRDEMNMLKKNEYRLVE